MTERPKATGPGDGRPSPSVARAYRWLRGGGSQPSGPAPRRTLFLDDDPRRAEMFRHRCPEAVWVMTVDACISQLETPWDEVHLDHDLGGEKFVDVNRDDCGMAVVRWLCAEDRAHLRNARFFIHSHNFAAASLMVECLLRNDYAAEFRPFGFDLVDFLSFEPPPRLSRRRILWRRLVARWQRLVDRARSPRRRVTDRLLARYDEFDETPDGLDPSDGPGKTGTSEKEP